jgi:putative hydrolase of the HAD superfamily
MPIHAIVFDIGGILEVVPDGGDPSARYPQMMEAWAIRLHNAPGTLARQLEALNDRLTAEGKDPALGTCTEEEWVAGLRSVTGMEDSTFATFMYEVWDIYMGELNVALADYFRNLRPRYRTALLSNSGVGAREQEEARFHFSELCAFIVYSHECGVAKPDRRIYEITWDRLGIRPQEMIFLDDASRNVEAASALGIHAILFQDNAQAIAAIEATLQV